MNERMTLDTTRILGLSLCLVGLLAATASAQPPPADNAQPPADGTQPPADENTQPPATENTQPPATDESAQPPADGVQPPADGVQPPADSVQPPATDESAVPPPADPAPAESVVQPATPPDQPASPPAPAPPTPMSDDPATDTGKKIHVGILAGVVLPQIASELGTSPGFEVTGGYRVWKNLSPFAGVSYSQPTVDHRGMDPRLPAMYRTDTAQRELTITLGALWRFLPMDSSFNAYAGLGARIWMLETITNGSSGGAEFLENRETSTRFGGAVQVGGEYILGPGAATARLDLGGSNLGHLITGDVTTTAISASVGYHLLF